MASALIDASALVALFGPGQPHGGRHRDQPEPPQRLDLLNWLAADTGITRIMTLDQRDFSRYRLPDGRAFEIL